MLTKQQLRDLAVFVLGADSVGLDLSDIEWFDEDHLGLRIGPEGDQPPFTLYDRGDLAASFEAGVKRGREEAEHDIKEQIEEAHAKGYLQGTKEGAAIEHDAWAADVEDEFGEAGIRFVERQHRHFVEAEARRGASATSTTALEGEAEIPQGTFHDTDGAQPGVGDGNADKGAQDEIDPYIYIKGSYLGFTYDLRVAITATAITVDGTLLGEEVDFTLSMVPFGVTTTTASGNSEAGATDATVTVDGETTAEAVTA